VTRPALRRPPTYLTAAVFLTLALVAGGELAADHRITLRGVLHTANLNTFRVVSSTNGVTTDVTKLGLRVGTANGEQRIALCKPAFLDPVSPFVNYTVLRATPENNPIAASYFVPTFDWNAGTPAELLFGMLSQNPAPVTTTYFAQLFQTLLARNNEPTVTLGVLLNGPNDFRFQSNPEVYFVIELGIPFLVRIRNFGPMCPDPRTNPVPPAPQPIPDFIMFWTSTRSGLASITVNNRVISSLPIRVTGQRVAETVLPRQVLARGENLVILTVLPDDLSVDELPVTTSVTLTIPDVICPFDPQRPPRQQPPR
jgi:hypothetical protein